MNKTNCLGLPKFALIIIIAICVFCLCACKSNVTSGSKFEVTDIQGTKYTLDEPVKKVVSTHNPTLNMVVILGNGTSKYLAGFGNKDKADGLYRKVLDDWNDLTVIGGTGTPINKETIIKLDPEFAIIPENLSKMKDEDWGDTNAKTFVILPTHETLDSIPDSLKTLSTLFKEEERAQKICDKYYEIAKINYDAFKNVKERPKVLFMGSSKYKVASSDMIQTQIIDGAGGTNASEGYFDSGFFASTDAETIVKMNPDVIYFPSYATFNKDDLLNDEKLQSVNAIKNKKVFKFPCNLEPWDYQSCSVCLGACWAKNNLHPDLLSKEQLINACNEFYQLLYNKTFTSQELGIE